MDAANTDKPLRHDSPKAVGDSPQVPSNDISKDSVNEKPVARDHVPSTTNQNPEIDNTTSSENGCDMGKQKQFLVKLKFNTNNTPAFLSRSADINIGSPV